MTPSSHFTKKIVIRNSQVAATKSAYLLPFLPILFSLLSSDQMFIPIFVLEPIPSYNLRDLDALLFSLLDFQPYLLNWIYPETI